MLRNKLYIVLISFFITGACNSALATDINADETETFTPIENKDLGIYVIAKIVDSKTNKPLENVKVISDSETKATDKNGEFFIKVNPNGYLNINLDGYKEANVKISELKGKIKLETVPDYLPLFPNNYISLGYRNLGFNESFNNISATGRINDSFSIDGSLRVLNNLLLTAGYENISGVYNRTQTSEKSSLSNNIGYLRADWIFGLLKDRLDLAVGLKAYMRAISSSNLVTNQDDPRDLDILDFNSQRIALGPEVELATRPIKYVPLVIGGNIAYYPYIIVMQDSNSPGPKNLSGFDYNIYARYDLMKFFIKPQFMGRNSFQGNYNSGYSGFAVNLGYSF